jgi:hypothetical protein
VTQYFYDDQSEFPIIVKQGHHGLGAKFEDDSNMGWVRVHGSQDGVQPLYVIPNMSFDPTEAELVGARAHSGSQAISTIENAPIVEFISWGYSHRYYAYHYPEVAPYWRDNLFTETRFLLRSLQADMSLAYEYLEGDPSLGAWMTHLAQSAKDFYQSHPLKIKPEDFDKLLDKTLAVSSAVRHATAADYSVLHDAGIQFMRIRWEQARLNRQVLARINGLVETAGQGELAARETEEASFWLLDLAGQVRFVNNPAGLAAYRCGVMVVRAGARGSGELIAGGSRRQAFLAARDIVRADFPKAVVGLLQGYMKLGSMSGKPSPMQTFEEKLVGVIVWYMFYTTDFFIFEVESLPADQKGAAGEIYWQRVTPELAVEIANALIATGMMIGSSGMPTGSDARKWMDRVAAALPALITSVVHEYVSMRKMADQEKRPFHDVFCAEIGWALVRTLKAVGKALAEAPIKDWMKRKMESDGPVFDVKFWRALIVAIQLELAELNPQMVKGGKSTPVVISVPAPTEESEGQNSAQLLKATDKPNLQKGKGGPDKNGNIGIHKFKRVAGAANPINQTKPSKPTRGQRRQVKTAPKANIRAGKEFWDAELDAEFEFNSKSVASKWPELRDKGPCYICENCKFVHNNKKYFQVDHVWDIQHGGDANHWSQADFQKVAASNDPDHLYTKGWQQMILCRGCNGAKNTEFDNAPGNIPKNSGYSRTKKDEDMNPRHKYQGGPDPD